MENSDVYTAAYLTEKDKDLVEQMFEQEREFASGIQPQKQGRDFHIITIPEIIELKEVAK